MTLAPMVWEERFIPFRYDAPEGDGPWHGLALAREISQITYRTTEVFDARFGRELFDSRDELSSWGRFQVES